MRFADDMIVYKVPRRRVNYDYGYSVDEAELARVEDAARMMSNQTLDDADYIRNVSRRSDNIAIEKANRMIEQSLQTPSAVRSVRYPEVVTVPRRRHLDRMTRSVSVSDVSRVEPNNYYYEEPIRVRPVYVPRRPVVTRHIPPRAHVPSSGVRRIYAPSPAKVAPAPPSEYRRRLERKLDTELLNYEMPSNADAYQGLKAHLRGVNDKMLAHRLLLDRYSGIEMAHPQRVEDKVESKCSELMARMPTLKRNRD